jgi:thiol-disulfide isomerase/thioredoxin
VNRVFLTLAVVAALLLPLKATAEFTLQTVLGASDWINGRPSSSSLSGKVVILDVFTYDCINCKHVLPELRMLYRTVRRGDLAVVGIHSPELSYERVRSNVVSELARQGVVWPVAIDNDHRLWTAYGIEYWPTQMIFDRHGHVRDIVIGEGSDERITADVRQLIAER